MNEKQWQQNVIDLAHMCGWLVYHTYDSRRSAPGFPDLVLIHPRHGILFRELKVGKNTTTLAQITWLLAIKEAGGDADVWRPEDIEQVQKELNHAD